MALLKLEHVSELFVHCADTPNGDAEYDIDDIDLWHKIRGFERAPRRTGRLRHVGYHAVICVDGAVQYGRDWDEIGAHAHGHNSRSWGVCLIGRDKFTPAQWDMLRRVIIDRLAVRPDLVIRGHREINPEKSCPGFDVQEWLHEGMGPLEGHIYMPR